MEHLKILLTTIAMLLSYVSANAEMVKVGELWYDIDNVNNTAEVIQNQDTGMHLYYVRDGNIIIPDSIEYDGKFMKVTSIGSAAFDGCTTLSSIVIPENLTSIGAVAFYGTSLTSVTIPDGVTSIGGNAFGGCSNLVSVTINSDSVLSKDFLQDGHAMHGLENNFGSQVKKYTIGGNVKKIGNYAFNGCDSLKTVNIIANVDSLGEYSFCGCNNLTSLTIPNSVTSIGNGAFYGCI